MQSTIWLSYDLGAVGDYEGMYTWLDDQGAEECGSGLAVFRYSYENDLVESLKGEISSAVSLNKRSRIYVIFRQNDKTKGRYLVGRRHGAPWVGFGNNNEPRDDED